MKKEKIKNRGITLIALIITIIVMLILVAVTVSVALNGGLFNYAKKAVGETQNAINAEQELANGKIKVGEKWYNNIDDYLNNIESSNPEVPGTGNLPEEIKVGDYVNYTPTPGTYEISDDITGLTGYTSNNFTPTGSQTFTTPIGEQALKWRVWKIDEESGKIEIISATPTTEKINLRGANGYNHGVDILNDMCKTLYSNENAIARSMTIEDINSKTTYNPQTDATDYGTVYTFSNCEYPVIYAKEIGSTENGLNETQNLLTVSEGVRLENGNADYNTYIGSKTADTLIVTNTNYDYRPASYLRTDLGRNNAPADLMIEGYWLASRTVSVSDLFGFTTEVVFTTRLQESDAETSYFVDPMFGYLVGNGVIENGGPFPVRPIVELPETTTWSLGKPQEDETPTWDITF